MLKQEELDQQKVELINDLVATSTVMEEYGDITLKTQIRKMLCLNMKF